MTIIHPRETMPMFEAPCPPARRASSALAGQVDAPCPPARRAIITSLRDERHIRFAWLELTGRCTLACTHCYSESGPAVIAGDKLDHDAWRAVLRRLSEIGCRRIQFIGGEPTLYPGLADLLLCAGALGYEEIEIFTNGIRLKPEVFDAVRKTRARLAVSLHGGTRAAHDRITGRPGSFDRTGETVRSAVAAGVPVRIAVIEHGDEAAVLSAIDAAHGWGVSDVDRYPLQPVGRAERSTAAEAAKFCGVCGQGMVCVRWDGYLYACVFRRSEPAGRVDDLWPAGQAPFA